MNCELCRKNKHTTILKSREDGLPRIFNVCAFCKTGIKKKSLKEKLFNCGYADGRYGHSPSLLCGPYMRGYTRGRAGL